MPIISGPFNSWEYKSISWLFIPKAVTVRIPLMACTAMVPAYHTIEKNREGGREGGREKRSGDDIMVSSSSSGSSRSNSSSSIINGSS